MVPPVGKRPFAPAADRELHTLLVNTFQLKRWNTAYPLRTPSTWMSIHHTPGMPKTHHKFALRKAPPGGAH